MDRLKLKPVGTHHRYTSTMVYTNVKLGLLRKTNQWKVSAPEYF